LLGPDVFLASEQLFQRGIVANRVPDRINFQSRDGKFDDNCEHKAHCPIRNFEKRKDLSRDLNEQASHRRVRDRHLVDIAPLQLGKEVVDLHCFDSALVLSTFWTSASNRGAPRRLS